MFGSKIACSIRYMYRINFYLFSNYPTTLFSSCFSRQTAVPRKYRTSARIYVHSQTAVWQTSTSKFEFTWVRGKAAPRHYFKSPSIARISIARALLQIHTRTM